MYGRVKRTLLQEIFALTLCVWIKAGVGPGMGTPFSYSAPGQANELVLMEWGNNPMELLVNDKVRENTHSFHAHKHTCFSFSNKPPPRPGCDPALVSGRWEVAPCLRDLVNTRRAVGGVPGRRAEGVWEQPLALAPSQTWRCLHSGAGTGNRGNNDHRRMLRLWNPHSPGCALSSSGHSGGPLRRLPVLRGGDGGRPHVVARADSQRHLRPGFLRQPPPGGRHRLVRRGAGAPRRRLHLPLGALSLKTGLADSGEA